MSQDGDYAKVLRDSADDFVMVVAVVASESELNAEEVASLAIRDALARLTENGTLGTAVEE